VLPIERGVVDPRLLLGAGTPLRPEGSAAGSATDDHDHDHDDHHDHTHVAMHALVVRRQGRWPRAELESRLRRLLAEEPILRLKGRLRQPDKRLPLQIQAVGPRLECWYEASGPAEAEAPALELVVLGAAADAQRLERAFAAF
jgi:cobalamin biosynthesis protein CobW